MKKIAYLIIPLFVFVFTSCEDNQPEIYNGDSISYFSETTTTFTIQDGSVFSGEVLVSSATSYDRTFTVEVDELTDAPDSSYTIDSNLVIPANSFTGSVEIAGNVLEVVTGSKLVLNLTSVEDSNVATFDNKLTITMEQFCPFVRDNFLGLMKADEEGYAVYDVNVTAGDLDNELVITNVWDTDPNSTTSIYLVEDGYVVEFPNYLDNYLYNNATYGAAYVDNGYGTWSSCETVIDIYFQVRVAAGFFSETHITFFKP